MGQPCRPRLGRPEDGAQAKTRGRPRVGRQKDASAAARTAASPKNLGEQLKRRGAGRQRCPDRLVEAEAHRLAARHATSSPRTRQCVKSRHACVHVYTYRPSRGGDDRLDKSNERITNPSMLTITMVDPSRSLTLLGAIARPNVSAIMLRFEYARGSRLR